MGHDGMSVDYDKIRKLVSLVEQNRLAELVVEEEGLSITIKAEPSPGASPPDVSQASWEVADWTVAVPASHGEVTPDVEQPSEHLYELKATVVGTFYRCPSPDSPPYVEVGDMVEVGQTVGLIEAMKVFSEVPCEVAGRVVAVPAENGKLVQQGDVLVVIDTSPTE